MDYKPRKLSVFEPVEHTQVDETWPDEANFIALREGIDAKGRFVACEGLGYAGKAIQLLPDQEVTFTFTVPKNADSLTIELHLLPTHPVDGEHLAVEVSLDGKQYSTETIQHCRLPHPGAKRGMEAECASEPGREECQVAQQTREKAGFEAQNAL